MANLCSALNNTKEIDSFSSPSSYSSFSYRLSAVLTIFLFWFWFKNKIVICEILKFLSSSLPSIAFFFFFFLLFLFVFFFLKFFGKKQFQLNSLWLLSKLIITIGSTINFFFRKKILLLFQYQITSKIGSKVILERR